MPPVESNHYCKDHQGNRSFYAKENCELCKAEARIRKLEETLEESKKLLVRSLKVFDPGEQGKRKEHYNELKCFLNRNMAAANIPSWSIFKNKTIEKEPSDRKMVVVIWNDSKGITSDWEDRARLAVLQCEKIKTVGFLMRENDSEIEIAQSMSEDFINGRFVIPRKSVDLLMTLSMSSEEL